MNSTNMYFYVPSNFTKYSKDDLQIMLDKLGYNFDDIEQTFVDEVGVIY